MILPVKSVPKNCNEEPLSFSGVIRPSVVVEHTAGMKLLVNHQVNPVSRSYFITGLF